MEDRRLQGTWRSDARRTGKEIDSWRDIPVRRKRKLKALFGKLQLRFTRTRCYASLNGVNWVHRYKVLAKDETGVAILTEEPDTHPRISHIYFESIYFWIHIGNGRLREFFRRMI
ncbi:MAG TPA: hypothetical protein VFB76_04930 [Candidatus Angelobacter sp.]|nr:hypothetical protein [Candidatus Angelobacter sp.]